MIPIGLRRCLQCGRLRGTTYWPEPDEPGWLTETPVSCLCEGIVCRHCKRNAIFRPISNYFDERDATIWHVSHFAAGRPCDECAAKGVGAS